MRNPWKKRDSSFTILLLIVMILPSLSTVAPVSAVACFSGHSPILIDGNDQFTQPNGVTSGTGTSDDPYIIQGLTFQASYLDTVLSIRNTDAFFVIRNVTAECGSVGIRFDGVGNARIENSTGGDYQGLIINDSWNVQVSNSKFRANTDAIMIANSSSIVLDNNRFLAGAHVGRVTSASDVTFSNNFASAESGISFINVGDVKIVHSQFIAHTALYITNCDSVNVDSNMIYGYDDGLSINSCVNVTVSNNHVGPYNWGYGLPGQSYGPGIDIHTSSSVTMTGNNVTLNKEGIHLASDTSDLSLSGNDINRNECGVWIDSSKVDQTQFLIDNQYTMNTRGDVCTTLSSNPDSPDWNIESPSWTCKYPPYPDSCANLKGSGLSGPGSPRIVSTATFPSDRIVQFHISTLTPGTGPLDVAAVLGKYVDLDNMVSVAITQDNIAHLSIVKDGMQHNHEKRVSADHYGTRQLSIIFSGDTVTVYKYEYDNIPHSLVIFNETDTFIGILGDARIGLASSGNSESLFAAPSIGWSITSNSCRDCKNAVKWTETFKGPGIGFAFSLLPTDDNGYLVVGTTNSHGVDPPGQVLITKLDNSGRPVWERTYGDHGE